MLDALNMYKNQNEDKDFPFIHCFKKLQGCQKWGAIRHTLNKEGVEEDGPVDPAGASNGRPIGNKKAKIERNAAPTLAAMDASLEKMISSFSTENKEAADRADEGRESEKQDMEIELEREKVEAAKMEAHAHQGHQRSNTAFVGQDVSRIQDLDGQHGEDGPIGEGVARDVPRAHRPRGAGGRAATASMTPLAPSTFMTPSAPSTFMPPPAPSMFMPPPATVDPVAAMELPPGLAADEQIVEVEPPVTSFI
jgi:hypothetical protein